LASLTDQVSYLKQISRIRTSEQKSYSYHGRRKSGKECDIFWVGKQLKTGKTLKTKGYNLVINWLDTLGDKPLISLLQGETVTVQSWPLKIQPTT
jgi:hypothetical protein